MKSIIQDLKECYVCSTYEVEDHHIYFGTAKRRKSEKYGLKVWLCPEHHRGTHGVHGKYGHELDTRLKRKAQEEFERIYTREEFIKTFGRSYLDDDIEY